MDGFKLGVIVWRHDAAVHLFQHGSSVAICGKSHLEGVVWESEKAERLQRPTCRACFRAWQRLVKPRIEDN